MFYELSDAKKAGKIKDFPFFAESGFTKNMTFRKLFRKVMNANWQWRT